MEICLEKCIHEDKVEHARVKLPPDEAVDQMADVFKALSDPGRLKIVTALFHGELCVCDLAVVCKMSDSAVSHQLRALRNLRIVRNRRDGKIVYYRLDDDHVRNLIENSIRHVSRDG